MNTRIRHTRRAPRFRRIARKSGRQAGHTTRRHSKNMGQQWGVRIPSSTLVLSIFCCLEGTGAFLVPVSFSSRDTAAVQRRSHHTSPLGSVLRRTAAGAPRMARDGDEGESAVVASNAEEAAAKAAKLRAFAAELRNQVCTKAEPYDKTHDDGACHDENADRLQPCNPPLMTEGGMVCGVWFALNYLWGRQGWRCRNFLSCHNQQQKQEGKYHITAVVLFPPGSVRVHVFCDKSRRWLLYRVPGIALFFWSAVCTFHSRNAFTECKCVCFGAGGFVGKVFRCGVHRPLPIIQAVGWQLHRDRKFVR